jgi:hypothetical protein
MTSSNTVTNLQADVVAFVDRREMVVAREAVKALQDAVDLKAELGLPVLPETRAAIAELEAQIHSLKQALLRSPHPDQLMLTGMEGLVAKEGKQEASRGGVAS